MDLITAEKLLAMKYAFNKNPLFLHTLTLYCFIFFLVFFFFFSLLLSSQSSWFPSHALSSMKRFWVVTSLFFSPRCLFVVLNLIVVYIIGELKLAGPKASPANEMYEDCVERSRTAGDIEYSNAEEKVEIQAEEDASRGGAGGDRRKQVEEAEEEEVWAEGGDEREKEKLMEEEEGGGGGELASEELNKRADAFIARVNKQRRLEEANCYFKR